MREPGDLFSEILSSNGLSLPVEKFPSYQFLSYRYSCFKIFDITLPCSYTYCTAGNVWGHEPWVMDLAHAPGPVTRILYDYLNHKKDDTDDTHSTLSEVQTI